MMFFISFLIIYEAHFYRDVREMFGVFREMTEDVGGRATDDNCCSASSPFSAFFPHGTTKRMKKSRPPT